MPDINNSNNQSTCAHIAPFSQEQLQALPKSAPVSLSVSLPQNKDDAISNIHQVYDPSSQKKISESIVKLGVAKNIFTDATQKIPNHPAVLKTQQNFSDQEQRLQQNAAQLKADNDNIYSNQDKITEVQASMRTMEIDAKKNFPDDWKNQLVKSDSYQSLQQKQNELQKNRAALIQNYETTKLSALQAAANTDQLVQNLPSTDDLISSASSIANQTKSQISSVFETSPPMDVCDISIQEFLQKSPMELENLKTVISQGLPSFPGMPALPTVPACDALSQNSAALSGVQLSADLPQIPKLPEMPPLPTLPALSAFVPSPDGISMTVPPGLLSSQPIPQIPSIPELPPLPSIDSVKLEGSLETLMSHPEADFFANLTKLSKIQIGLDKIPQLLSIKAKIPNLQPALGKNDGQFTTPALPKLPEIPHLPSMPSAPGFPDLTMFAGKTIPSPTELLKMRDQLPQADFCRHCAFWVDIQSRVSTYQSFTDYAKVGQVYHYSSIAQLVQAQIQASASQTTLAQQLITQKDTVQQTQQVPSKVLALLREQTKISVQNNACTDPKCPLSHMPQSSSPSSAQMSEKFADPLNKESGILSPKPNIIAGGENNDAVAANLTALNKKFPAQSRPIEIQKMDLEDACVKPEKMTALEQSLSEAPLVILHDVDLLSDPAISLAAEIQRKVSAQGVSVLIMTSGRPITNPVTSAFLEKVIYQNNGQVSCV